MSKVLLGHSYFMRFDPKLWQAMQPYAPLGTLYAAATLREREYDVALFDAILAESETDWEAALEREQPRFAVLFEDNFNYLSKMCLLRMRQAAFKMIELAKQRGCTVILCGSDVTDHTLEYLAKGADYAIRGEGEQTLVELLDRLDGRSQQPLNTVLGLAYTADQDSGNLVSTPARPDLKNPDVLPFPAWDLVDVERYRQIWLERHGYYSMNMVTTRGCPFHCNWCAKPIWGQRYNSRSPENVAAELKWLRETYRPDHIWFADDILGLKPGWLPRFAELVESQAARLPFKCLSRVDLLLRPGEIAALKQAGAEIVWVGAESGSQKILDAMEKGTKVEQIYEAARQVHAAGMRIAFFLQFGYPGEQREDIEKTLQMVRDCRPDDIGISVSYPLPGTKFFERVQAQLGDKQNWETSDDLEMLYEGPYTTQYYRQLHGVVHKEYRMRKYAHELAGLPRHPADLSRRHALHTAQLVYYAATLPLDRRLLRKLESAPHQSMPPIQQGMSQEQAAQPTPQGK